MSTTSSEQIVGSVFHTLAYGDVFDYPLTAPEVYRYLAYTPASAEDVRRALTDAALFSRVDEYFTLRGREYIVETRKQRAVSAARLWKKAERYGRVLALLPFVRMVAVTGSLAMNNTDEGKDVDYMIVVTPGRLWTCRVLALLIGRIARLDGVTLCPNYMVTTRALLLKERSLYVARELTQMVPLAGWDTYQELCQQNEWIRGYLPNALDVSARTQPVPSPRGRPALQRLLEFVGMLPVFRWLEKWEMDRKIKRLRREQSASSESCFSADVCKGHVDRHGARLEDALTARLQDLPELQQTARDLEVSRTA